VRMRPTWADSKADVAAAMDKYEATDAAAAKKAFLEGAFVFVFLSFLLSFDAALVRFTCIVSRVCEMKWNVPNLTNFCLCSVIPLVHPSTHGLASIRIFRISETPHTYAHNNTELFAEKSTRRSKKSIVNVHDIHAFVDKTPPLIQRPTTVGGLDKRAADSYWKAYRPNKTDGITS
jgi:hypothetical protein